MHNSQSLSQATKLALIVMSAAVVSQFVVGCNVDEKPSKMVQMRQQMDQQKKMQGNHANNAAPGTQPPANTGQ